MIKMRTAPLSPFLLDSVFKFMLEWRISSWGPLLYFVTKSIHFSSLLRNRSTLVHSVLLACCYQFFQCNQLFIWVKIGIWSLQNYQLLQLFSAYEVAMIFRFQNLIMDAHLFQSQVLNFFYTMEKKFHIFMLCAFPLLDFTVWCVPNRIIFC